MRIGDIKNKYTWWDGLRILLQLKNIFRCESAERMQILESAEKKRILRIAVINKNLLRAAVYHIFSFVGIRYMLSAVDLKQGEKITVLTK